MSIEVAVRVLPHGQGLPLPAYATAGSAGLDLMAALAEGETLTLAPLARAAVPTGLALALPEGFEAQVRPRSGLALKQGLTVLNAPGTVDSDYRGEVKVILVNLGAEPVVLERGQRIAQMVVAPVTRIHLVDVGNLEETTRGEGGFGSTGLDGRQISR
ncbi:dUTP diphosphatase [Ancylobacter aquaticus]|nr:dUTP diphosphatase [Ancylobacter aquaticus]